MSDYALLDRTPEKTLKCKRQASIAQWGLFVLIGFIVTFIAFHQTVSAGSGISSIVQAEFRETTNPKNVFIRNFPKNIYCTSSISNTGIFGVTQWSRGGRYRLDHPSCTYNRLGRLNAGINWGEIWEITRDREFPHQDGSSRSLNINIRRSQSGIFENNMHFRYIRTAEFIYCNAFDSNISAQLPLRGIFHSFDSTPSGIGRFFSYSDISSHPFFLSNHPDELKKGNESENTGKNLYAPINRRFLFTLFSVLFGFFLSLLG